MTIIEILMDDDIISFALSFLQNFLPNCLYYNMIKTWIKEEIQALLQHYSINEVNVNTSGIGNLYAFPI